MPITQTIPLPLDGVSQQPDEIRAATCAAVMDNCDATPVRGLSTRPGTKHIAALSGLTASAYQNSYVHFIDRSATEKWFVLLNGSTVQIVNALTGALATVTYQDETGATISAPSYLTATTPRDSFKCTTVGDYTFVANREVTVTSSALTTTYSGGTQYFQSTTSTGFPATPAANTLYVITGTATDGSSRYYLKQSALSSSVYVETCWTSVTQIDKASMPWTIVKTGTTSFAFRRGNYVPPQVGEDSTNFPPSFIGRQIRDVFFYRNRVGFITASSVVLSQPLTNINAALGIQYNFYRKSMTIVADDDVIDATISHSKAPTLNSAALYNKTLIIFGDTVQFQLQPLGDILSPKTFAINPVTEFDCSQTIRPIGLGPRVYFSQPSTGGMRVREFYVQKDKLALDAVDVTAQCPTYVPPNMYAFVSSASENMIVGATTAYTAPVGTSNNALGSYLYVYRPDFDGKGERTQSAWCRYTLNASESEQVVGLGFAQSVLYLVISRTSGVFLESIDYITPAASLTSTGIRPFATGTSGTIPLWVCMDRLATYNSGTGTYSTSTGRTTWTCAWDMSGITAGTQIDVVVLDSTGAPSSSTGYVLAGTRDTATTFSVLGDYSLNKIAAGYRVPMNVVLSRIQMQRRDGPMVLGNLRLRTVELSMRDSGPVALTGYASSQAPHGGTAGGFGVGLTTIGSASSFTGRGRITVNTSAEKTAIALTNTTPLRATVTAITWEGEYMRRSERV